MKRWERVFILDYEKKVYSDAVLYASINVLYLKLIQYEKYNLPLNFVNIHNLIDRKLEILIGNGQNKLFRGLDEILKSSVVKINFDRQELSKKMLNSFLTDIKSLSELDKELSIELGYEILKL